VLWQHRAPDGRRADFKVRYFYLLFIYFQDGDCGSCVLSLDLPVLRQRAGICVFSVEFFCETQVGSEVNYYFFFEVKTVVCFH